MGLVKKLMAWLLPAQPKHLSDWWLAGSGAANCSQQIEKEQAFVDAFAASEAWPPPHPIWTEARCFDPACPVCTRRRMIASMYSPSMN